nr:hypothetical protein [Candidatus Sigynarchaeota archaeon]
RLKDKDMVAFLKKITREQKLNNFEYRQYSVGHTCWGDLVAMKTPFVPEEGFQLRQVTTEGKKEQIKRDLIEKLIEIDLVDEPIQTVYGYLFDLKTRDHVLELYNFGQNDFKEIIYRAKAKMLLDGSTATRNETYLYKLWKFIQTKGEISFQDLEDATGMPHSVMHRIVSKFKRMPGQGGLTPVSTGVS